MIEKNKYEHIGKYISQIYRKGGRYITKALSKEGIGAGQLMYLMQLYQCDGRNQEDLSDALNIDKGTTARALKKLEDEEFIVRIVDEDDKRAYKVYLTDKGRSAKAKVYEAIDAWENIITESLTEEEKETMIKLLMKICTNIK